MEDSNKFIENLYLKMYDQLYVYAYANLRNQSLAEEAVQEVFVICCNKKEVVQQSPCPEGWLLNTLRYVILNMKKNNAKATKALAKVMKSFNLTVELLPSVETLYGNLFEKDEFQLLWETAFEGMSQLEMARKRGISLDACKKRVQRAKLKLRKAIQQ